MDENLKIILLAMYRFGRADEAVAHGLEETPTLFTFADFERHLSQHDWTNVRLVRG